MSEEFLSPFVLNYSSSSFFFLPQSLNPSPPAPRDATAMLTHPQMLVASPVFALSLFLEVEVLDTLLLASGVDVAFGVLVGVFVGCVVGIVVGAVVGVVVGAVVGVTVGVSVGVTVGVSVGVTVGVSVGVTVGVSVGVGVGSSADFFQVKLRS